LARSSGPRTSDGRSRKGGRRRGRFALCPRRPGGQLARIASSDLLRCVALCAGRDADARTRRHGRIRLLLAPDARNPRSGRRADERLRISDRNEIHGMAARNEDRGGADRLHRAAPRRLEDERRHIRRSLLRGAEAPLPAFPAQKRPMTKSFHTMKYALISTEKGDLKAELYEKETPLTVANFVKLAQPRFYDGLTVHRVIPDCVVQGG